MTPPEAAIAVGIGNGNDLFICRQGRLYLGSHHPDICIDVRMTKTRAKVSDIDLIIESLQRLRVHVDP